METKKKAVISLRGLKKDFPSGNGVLHVLKGIDLDIYESEFLVIHGESGSGKTTLLNIIGGMDVLTDGKLIVYGRDFSHASEQELTEYRRKNVGFVFQTYNLMPNLTAKENIRFIADLSQNPMDVRKVMEMVKITHSARKFPGQMSGGEQQRVAIARAIVKSPEIILADEPTAALDYSTGVEVLSAIEEIVKSTNTTVVMVTHNAEIGKMADRTIEIRDGKIADVRENGTALHAEELVW